MSGQRPSAGGGTISRGVLYQRGVLYASLYGSTRRDPSSFELPSSSAPPVLNRLTTEQLYVVNSGLSRLQNGHQDLYEPGTQGGRRVYI
jgi:hypothetical protein